MNLLSRIKKRLDKNSSYWLVLIFLFLLASIVTIFFKFWLTSVFLITAALITTVFAFILIRDMIKKSWDAVTELQRKIEKKDNYISDFSHRIRTPLNNLPLINDLLSKLSVQKDQKELLDTLVSSTNNMISALNELTMRSAGEISIKPRSNIRFELRKIIDNTMELLDLESAANIKLNISWDDKISREYMGDPVAIKQIFIDIFGIWSTIPESEKLEVDISLKRLSNKGLTDIIEFIIETETPYEEKNIHSHDITTDRSLAAKIINILEGHYSYQIKDNKLVFRFTLPLIRMSDDRKVSAVGERIRRLNIVSGKKERKLLSEASILLVEDNIANQKIVTISLASKVKNIDTAIDGKEALDMFGKSNYDIILMDIQLPVMDGITASRKIREIEASTNRHTPIIAITANAMIGDKEKCLAAGIDDYLSKPFQPVKLLAMINKYLTAPEQD
ncbi:MAG: response regulator [Bacteroidales bacterium]|nr:response regulator [Bacteroidales bacterium]